MFPHIIGVELGVLAQTHQMGQFRQDGYGFVLSLPPDPAAFRRQTAFHHQVHTFPGIGPHEQLVQFRTDPFQGQARDLLEIPADGGQDGRIRGKPQLPHEPTGPEHPQGIFRKPPVRIPHRAQHPAPEIIQPMETVGDVAFLIHGQGIDGEIPPAQIFFQGFAVPDF